jgi:hypothetical protein
MAFSRLPAGMPGTITWKAKQLGLPTYMLAISAAGQPGRSGRQARFYLSQTMHHRMRGLAKAAGSNPSSTL